MFEEVLKKVLEVVRDLNQGLPEDKRIAENPTAILFGREGALDSLGLVELIVEVEQEVNDHFDVDIGIADERAISQEKSPFQTLETMSNYIVRLIAEAREAT